MKKILVLVLAFACVLSLVACGKDCTAHVDANADGKCDNCKAAYTCPGHSDANVDGKCDTCNAAYTCPGHVDANGDKKCDTCKAVYVCPGHSDINSDGKCDTCKASFTCPGHADVNSDGKCDNCKIDFVCPGHTDVNEDGKCDTCRIPYICPGHADVNEDGECDNCSAPFVCPGHTDVDGDGSCDTCEAPFACPGHVDANIDEKCDICSAPFVLNPASLDAFINAYKNSAPTKVQTEIKRIYGNAAYELNGSYELVTGVCAGKTATVYTAIYDEFRTVDEGADEIIMDKIKTTKYEKVFLSGEGVRETTVVDDVVTGGNWESKGTNFAPTAGSIAIGLSEANIKNARFNIKDYDHVVVFTVPKAKVKAVFGSDIDATSDVQVVLGSNGATITSLSLSYNVAGDAKEGYPDQRVVVSTHYEYGIQTITIE